MISKNERMRILKGLSEKINQHEKEIIILKERYKSVYYEPVGE